MPTRQYKYIQIVIPIFFYSVSPLYAQKLLPNVKTCTLSIIKTDIGCNGVCDGTATAIVAGGTPPYTYSWNTIPAQITSIATGLCAGTYMVTVTDGNTCIGSGIELAINGDFEAGNVGFSSNYTYCDTVDCLYPPAMYAVGNDASFFHPFAFIGFDHTSGTGNFMIINGDTAINTSIWCQSIPVIPNTNYIFSTWLSSMNTVNVAQLQFSINGINIGNIFTAPSSINTWQQFFVTWNSGSDTSALICIVNQNTIWSGNDFGIDDISFQECVTSCIVTGSITITEPSPIILSFSSTSAACGVSDGTATVSVIGGTTPYVFLWTGGQTTATVTGLATGYYYVTVTDSNNCTQTDSIFVFNTGGAIVSILSTNDVSCFGSNDGQVIVTVLGGTVPYTYSWAPIGGNSDTATGLSSGNYTCTVIDASGCVSVVSTTITEPDSIIVMITDSITICLGDSAIISAFASGGTEPYTYTWDNGLGNGNTQVVSPALTTTYTVSVEDANFCTGVVQLVIISIKPTIGPLSVTISGSTTICFGDSTSISAIGSGGDGGPYTYIWNNGADTGNTILVSPAITTTYTVTISDACNSSTATDTVTVSVNPIPVADFEFNPIETTIINPLFDFQDQSSQGVVFWYWDFGDGDTAFIANPTHTYSDTGNYPVMLVVTDVTGCQDSIVKYVIVRNTYILFAPSAFFPNSNIKENRSFLPKGLGFQNSNFEMIIYNRWGEEIFKTNDATKGWNGRTNDRKKTVQQDVYIWLIKTKEENGKRHLYVGHVTLIR